MERIRAVDIERIEQERTRARFTEVAGQPDRHRAVGKSHHLGIDVDLDQRRCGSTPVPVSAGLLTELVTSQPVDLWFFSARASAASARVTSAPCQRGHHRAESSENEACAPSATTWEVPFRSLSRVGEPNATELRHATRGAEPPGPALAKPDTRAADSRSGRPGPRPGSPTSAISVLPVSWPSWSRCPLPTQRCRRRPWPRLRGFASRSRRR